jgi:hypothetical protein
MLPVQNITVIEHKYDGGDVIGSIGVDADSGEELLLGMHRQKPSETVPEERLLGQWRLRVRRGRSLQQHGRPRGDVSGGGQNVVRGRSGNVH